MDLKTLLPDFNAIKNTQWNKPQVDTKDTPGLLALGCSVLMLVFVFLPWLTVTVNNPLGGGSTEASALGITTVWGILGFICTLAAIVGTLYKHYSLSFSAGVLALIFGIVGCFAICDLEKNGVTETADAIRLAIGLGVAKASHLGAILFTIASAGTVLLSYSKVSKK